jgi:uncharacterized membrane protein YgcG
VSLVEDGFAMASATEMRLELLFRLDRDFADFAALHSVNFPREPRFVQTAGDVLAVHDGRAALDGANAAGFAAARNCRTRPAVMIGAKKALAYSNRAAADFAGRETRDVVGGGGGGRAASGGGGGGGGRAASGGSGGGTADFRSTERRTGGGV